MLKYLLYIALAVTPFITIQGMDSRYPKEVFALGVALLIFLYMVSRETLKKFDNKWVLLFIGWSILSAFFAPKWLGLNLYNGGNVDGLWNYKALLQIVIYFLALWAISSANFSHKTLDIMINIIAHSGVIMVFYVFLQAIGIDPLYKVSLLEATTYTPSYKLTGTLGHPTIVSAFILMCIPMAIYLRKYWMVALMVIALLMTKSVVAIVALVGSIIYFVLCKNLFKLTVVNIVIFVIIILGLYYEILGNSGRFAVWTMAFNDMKSNPITFLTGFGIGSFSYIFTPLMHSSYTYWAQLHNEYFEIIWGVGLVGLFFAIKSGIWLFDKIQTLLEDRTIRCLMTSIVAVCFISLGNFVLHLGVFHIYMVIILGVLMQKIRKKGESICIS